MVPLAFSVQDQVDKYGVYLGIASFFGLAVLSLLYFAQAREVKRLRDWAGRAPERAQELEARVVAQAEEARREALPQPAGAPQRPITARSDNVGGAQPVAVPAMVAAANGTVVGERTPADYAAAAFARAAGVKLPERAPATVAAAPAADTEVKPESEAADVAAAPAAPDTKLEAEGEAAADAAAAPAATGNGAGRRDAVTPLPASRAATPEAPPTPASPGAAAEAPTSASPAAAPEAPTSASPAAAPEAPPPSASPAATSTAAPPVPRAATSAARRAQGVAAPQPSATLPPRRATPPPPRRGLAASAPPSRRGRSTTTFALLIVAGLVAIGGAVYAATHLLGRDDGATPATAPAPFRPGRAQLTPTPPVPLTPATTRVTVLNGTPSPGLAATVRDQLTQDGYKGENIATGNNTDQQQAQSRVLYRGGAGGQARAVARSLGITAPPRAVDPDTQALADSARKGGASDVIVVVGADKAP